VSDARRRANATLTKRLLAIAGGAFLFAFSLVPLYRIACERLLGIKLESGAANAAVVDAMGIDRTRTVTVQFDANVSDGLGWSFAPGVPSLEVHPGEAAETWFVAANPADVAIVGNAVPSIAPNVASGFFAKTECFCFTEQLLRGQETRRMPVRFVVDPKLPRDISTITLSYRFFVNEAATERVAANAAAASQASGDGAP
jgi:cytochrome c oxidase assembly protein subunit 11